MKLALFDLDKTLLPIDSDRAWGDFCVTKGWVEAENFAQRNAAFYEDYVRGALDIEAYTAFATSMLVGKSHRELRTMHEAFMRQCIAPCILPPAVELVQSYQEKGWETILITATNEFVTRPIARALGFAHFIAIELERDGQGHWWNRLRGVPSLGAGKVARLHQWLACRGMDWSGVRESVMYSDSINDVPLLELAHRAIATNPDEYLLKVARARGWPVLHLFEGVAQ